MPARLPVHLSADGRCIRSDWAMQPRTVVGDGGEGGREREFTRQRERERERERRAYGGGATRGKRRIFTGARQRGDGGAEAKRLINRYYTGVKQRTAPP